MAAQLPSLIFQAVPHSLPHLDKRLATSLQRGILPVFSSLVVSLDLPYLPAILIGDWSKARCIGEEPHAGI